MAETLKIVQFPYRGARPLTVLDLNNGTTYQNVRDSFKVIPATKNQQFSESQRRFGGATLANETHSNGAIEATTYIKGASKDQSEQLMEAMLQTMETLPGLGKRYVEWRPDGGTYSVFFEIKGNMPYEPMYRWVEFQGTGTLQLKWSLATAPLAEGLPMYGIDRFDAVNDGSTLTDYTFGAGASSDVALSGSAPYTLTSVTNHSTTKVMIESLRNYSNSDWFAAVAFECGAASNNFLTGVVLKYINATNYVSARVADNGSNSRVEIVQTVGGVDSTLDTFNITRLSTSGVYILEANMVGSRVTVKIGKAYHPSSEQFGKPAQILSLFGATLMASPTVAYRDAVVTDAALSAATSGGVGLIWTPLNGSSVIHEFAHCAFTANADNQVVLNATSPFEPSGNIPGTAPAKVDLFLRPTNKTTPFALVGWTRGLKTFDYVWNGDFEVNTAGWSTTAQSGLNTVNATSLTRNASAAYQGQAGGVLTLPSNSGAGANFKVYGEFKKGETYTFSLAAAYASGDTGGSLLCGLGVSGADRGTATFSGFVGSNFSTAIGTWTPAADANAAWFFVARATAAGGSTVFNIDVAKAYKGTVVPNVQTQAGGRGAYPLFGALPTAAASDVSGSTAVAAIGGRYGSGLRTTSAATAGSGSASVWVDPNLGLPDDYGSGEISVEVWGHVRALGGSVVTPRFVLSAVPAENGTLVTGSTRYTEFGANGTAAVAGLQRLGTLSFPVGAENEAGRWKLTLVTKYGNGSSGNIDVEALFCVPAQKRASSPTGLTLDSTYPYFSNGIAYPVPTDFPAGKLLKADGSGAFLQPSSEIDTLYSDHALGGSLCQPDAGSPINVFVRYGRGSVVPGTTVELGFRTQLLVTPRFNVVRGS